MFKSFVTGLALLISAVCTTVSANTERQSTFRQETQVIDELACELKDYKGLDPELRYAVYDKVKQLLMVANQKLPFDYFDYPVIIFEIPAEALTAAGYWDYTNEILLINPLYLARYKQPFIDDVVTHEVAHYIAHVIGKGNEPSHGETWQKVMKEVYGVKEPQPYHFYLLCVSELKKL